MTFACDSHISTFVLGAFIPNKKQYKTLKITKIVNISTL
jgi:hypothetical protein